MDAHYIQSPAYEEVTYERPFLRFADCFGRSI